MRPLVVTVSPNPSVDRIAVIRDFRSVRPSRTVRAFHQAGGSGVHASGVILELGGATRAIVLLGGLNGARWRTIAAAASIPYDAVEIDGEIRSSFVLLDEDLGIIAEVIDPGPAVGPTEASSLLDLLGDRLPQASLTVLSGSLPPGMPADVYARAIGLAGRHDVPVLVDAHSEPNRLAVAANPWAVKQNLDEFHQLTGRAASTAAQREAGLIELVHAGTRVALLTMGAEGLLLCSQEGVWHVSVRGRAPTPRRAGWNTVGCGDAFVGAFTWRFVETGDLVDAARWGVAAAEATLSTDGVPASPRADVVACLARTEADRIARPHPRGRRATRSSRTESPSPVPRQGDGPRVGADDEPDPACR